MRQLTKNEIVNKPHWAKAYFIPKGKEPIFYAKAGDGVITIPCEEFDAQQQEIECLKKQVSQLKSENISMAAYADQRINMLTRANKKLGGEL